MTTHHLESTSETDARRGMRQILTTVGNGFGEIVVVITAVHREQVALEGEAPRFENTGNLTDNHTLGKALVDLGNRLLAHLYGSRLHQ